MNARWDLHRDHMLSAAIVAVCPVIAWFVISQTGEIPLLATVGLVAGVVAIYIGLRHPLWLYWCLAIVLGFLPFGYVPGVHVPLYLLFAAGVIAALILHPRERKPLSSVELSIVVLLITALMSLLATKMSLTAILIFIQWSICTSLVFALLRLRPEQLMMFGRVFVCAATLNSAFGIVIVLFDKQQRFIKILKPFGYGEGVGLREQTSLYAFGAQMQSLRLGGTWVLPNSAGLAILIALAVCWVVFKGWPRVYFSAIMMVALALTLSRSALFSAAAGVLVVLIFHGMRARDRQLTIGLIALGTATVFLIPATRDRIMSSFTSHDAGTDARLRAFEDFPGLMAGRWLFGAGWGGREFKDGQVGQTLNPPSNVPLLTVYRAGVLTGLAITVVLIVASIVAYRLIRSKSLPYALFGGMTIGVSIIACNLDKTIVDILPVTASYSMMLAFLVHLVRTPPDLQHAYPPTREPALSVST